MACEFEVPFNGDPELVLQKAKEFVESQGGNFSGDIATGEFGVSVFGNRVAGSYVVAGNVLTMHISEKPMMIPCSMIESMLASKLK